MSALETFDYEAHRQSLQEFYKNMPAIPPGFEDFFAAIPETEHVNLRKDLAVSLHGKVPIAQARRLTLDMIKDGFYGDVAPIKARWDEYQAAHDYDEHEELQHDPDAAADELPFVKALLNKCPAAGLTRDGWRDVYFAIGSKREHHTDEYKQALDDWSAEDSERYNKKQSCDFMWEEACKNPAGGIGMGTLMHYVAEANGIKDDDREGYVRFFRKLRFELHDAERKSPEAIDDLIKRYAATAAPSSQATVDETASPFLRNAAIWTRPQPEELIAGFLQSGGTCCLFGHWGSAKSYVAIDIGISVASGLPAFGDVALVIKRPGPVIYLAGEGDGGFGNRVLACRRSKGIKDDADIPFIYRGQVPRADDLVACEKFIKEIQTELVGEIPALIIVDTMAKAAGSVDLDKGQGAGNVIFLAREMSRLLGDCTVLLIAHPPKANARDREATIKGSGDLGGDFDWIYLTVKKEDSDVVELIPNKKRDAELGPPITLKLGRIEVWPEAEALAVRVNRFLAPATVEKGQSGETLTAKSRVREQVARVLLQCEENVSYKTGMSTEALAQRLVAGIEDDGGKAETIWRRDLNGFQKLHWPLCEFTETMGHGKRKWFMSKKLRTEFAQRWDLPETEGNQ